MYTDKSKSLLEPDSGRSCSEVQQHTIHCMFLRSGSWTANLASIITKSIRVNQPTLSYKGQGRLAARCISLSAPSLCTLTSSSLRRRLLIRLGPRKLEEWKREKLVQLQNEIACGKPIATSTKYHALLPTEEVRTTPPIKQEEQLAMPNGYTPSLLRKSIWTCVWGSYWYIGGQTSTKALYIKCAVSRTKAWTHR